MLQTHRKYQIGMIRFLLAGSVVLGMGEILDGQEQSLEQSVVMIRAVSQDYDYSTPWKKQSMSQGSGTGFIVAGNRILTNAHNVSNNQ